MGQFMYFVPEQGEVLELAARYGLADRLGAPYPDGSPGLNRRGCTVWPEGDALRLHAPDVEPVRGVILSLSNEMGFFPDRQEWVRVEAEGKHYWLGWEPGDLPGPAELARPDMVGGHEVVLAGGKWEVPVARCFPQGTRLPQRVLLGPDGGVTLTLRKDYLGLFERAEALAGEVYGKLAAGEAEDVAPDRSTVGVTVADGVLLALDALAVNYRLGWPEANALELLDTQGVMRVLRAVVDMPGFEKMARELAAEDASKKAPGA